MWTAEIEKQEQLKQPDKHSEGIMLKPWKSHEKLPACPGEVARSQDLVEGRTEAGKWVRNPAAGLRWHVALDV